jgi:hypothetical protein
MPHVTFIHGISNKPPEQDLLRLWREAMANAAEPLPLGDLGVTSSLVYWADLLYESPDQDLSAYEGMLESTPEAVDAGGGATPPQPRTVEEAKFLAGLAAKMTVLTTAEMAADDTSPVPAVPQGVLERVPLPWFLKKRFPQMGAAEYRRRRDERWRGNIWHLRVSRRVPARRAPLPIRCRVRPARQAARADPADHPPTLCRGRQRARDHAAARCRFPQPRHCDRV